MRVEDIKTRIVDDTALLRWGYRFQYFARFNTAARPTLAAAGASMSAVSGHVGYDAPLLRVDRRASLSPRCRPPPSLLFHASYIRHSAATQGRPRLPLLPPFKSYTRRDFDDSFITSRHRARRHESAGHAMGLAKSTSLIAALLTAARPCSCHDCTGIAPFLTARPASS